MKKSNGKFFVVIGILLTIAGGIIFPDDPVIGVLGIIMGVYNIIKGIRLLRGIQPMLIRKQIEREQALKQEVKDKVDNANKNRNRNRNKSNR